MGFLIFAFRKLSLRREISQKEYRLMSISTIQNRIQDQISVIEQAKAAMQGAWNTSMNAISTMGSSIFSNGLMDKQQSFMDLNISYLDAKSNGDTVLADSLRKQMLDAQKAAMGEQATNQKEYQIFQQGLMLANQAQNTIFSLVDQAELASLNQQDQQYSLEKENLESQLKKLNAEYESVEKAETQAAKQAAPNLGLA